MAAWLKPPHALPLAVPLLRKAAENPTVTKLLRRPETGCRASWGPQVEVGTVPPSGWTEGGGVPPHPRSLTLWSSSA